MPDNSRIAQAADQLHENWRSEWRARNGDAPRWKPLKPEGIQWLAEHPGIPQEALRAAANGGQEINIAALPNSMLPPQFAGENVASARGAIEAIGQNPNTGMEELAAKVHEQWLERNGSWAPESQKVSYELLSEAEKEKDRVVVRAARQAMEGERIALAEARLASRPAVSAATAVDEAALSSATEASKAAPAAADTGKIARIAEGVAQEANVATKVAEGAAEAGTASKAAESVGIGGKLAKAAGPIAIAVTAGEVVAAGINGNTAVVNAQETAADPKNAGNVEMVRGLAKAATSVIDLLVVPVDPETKQPDFHNTLSDRAARAASGLLARRETSSDKTKHTNLKNAMTLMGRDPKTLEGMDTEKLYRLARDLTLNIEGHASKRDTGDLQRGWFSKLVAWSDDSGRAEAIGKLDYLLAARDELALLQSERAVTAKRVMELGKCESGKGPEEVCATSEQPAEIPAGHAIVGPLKAPSATRLNK